MEEPEKRYVVKYGNNYDNCEEEFYSLDKVISFCALIKHRNKYPHFNGFDGHRDKTFSVNEILIIEERNLMYESEFCKAVEKENERLNFKSKQELQVSKLKDKIDVMNRKISQKHNELVRLKNELNEDAIKRRENEIVEIEDSVKCKEAELCELKNLVNI